MKCTKLFVVAGLTLTLCSPVPLFAEINLVTGHVVSFPYIVSGPTGEVTAETVVVLSNPSAEALDIRIEDRARHKTRTENLGAFETTELAYRSDALVAGSLLFAAERPFIASAHIGIRESGSSGRVLTRISIPGSVPTNKVALPVQVRSPLADNTSFSLVRHMPAGEGWYLKCSLYDLTGDLIRERVLPGDYTAQFVTEFFPDLPEDFHSGNLIIELISPVPQSMMFSTLVLYTAGDKVFTASQTDLEQPGLFSVVLGGFSGADRDRNLAELKQHYNLQISRHVEGSTAATVRTTRGVAQVMARDPRVFSISLNFIVIIAPGALAPPV
ncbi:MAG: hypothetical protein EHM23_16595 [Acidobacteria bacterium]|nr:MAG: hypothetical protein EHM23_16595 [Acidobacteriota bacterium]